MTKEQSEIRNDISNLSFLLNGSVIEHIDLFIDSDPTFNKAAVPFKFEYCHSIGFQLEKTYIHLFPRQTLEGLYTFGVNVLTEQPKLIGLQSIKLDQSLSHFESKNAITSYPYKISLDFDDKKLFIVCGEIYDTLESNVLDYKINDEMILFFEHVEDLEMFELQVAPMLTKPT